MDDSAGEFKDVSGRGTTGFPKFDINKGELECFVTWLMGMKRRQREAEHVATDVSKAIRNVSRVFSWDVLLDPKKLRVTWNTGRRTSKPRLS